MPITPRSGGIDGKCATPTISARSEFARSTLDWTWGHHVDAYPRCGGFERGRLRQSFNCMLARRVYRSASSASMAVRRGHVDDTAASLGKHQAHLMLHAEQRTQNVCVERRGVGFCSLFRYRARLALSSSAIDGNIQTAKARDGRIHQITHIIFVADVSTDKNGLCSEPLQLGS